MQITINTKHSGMGNIGPCYMVRLDENEPRELTVTELFHVLSEILISEIPPRYMRYTDPKQKLLGLDEVRNGKEPNFTTEDEKWILKEAKKTEINKHKLEQTKENFSFDQMQEGEEIQPKQPTNNL